MTYQPQTYLYSDPHFGHHGMAEVFTLADGSPARPFRNVAEMDNTLIKNYWDVVRSSDTVWWLGDVGFSMSADLKARIAALPGKRYLIFGNHDRESIKLYQALGFTRFRGYWQDGRMLVSHIPCHPSCIPAGGFNIHGHTHTRNLGSPYVNICVEQTNYKPISLQEARQRGESCMKKST